MQRGQAGLLLCLVAALVAGQCALSSPLALRSQLVGAPHPLAHDHWDLK